MVMQRQPAEVQATYQSLLERAGALIHDTSALMQYWADGRHTIADISDLVAMETGQTPGRLALDYLTLLAQTGLVVLDPASSIS